VMSVSGGAISTTFTYDANGNQTSGLGRSIVFTSYNKPASITQGTRTISFLDDSDHQRFEQVTPEGSTLYISAFGVLTELTNPGAAGQKWTDYLSVGDAQVGMRVLQTASETLSTRYFHTDHLGSISVITDENGLVVEQLSYDAWGKRRFPNGTDDPTGSITSQSTHGFAGEEELSVSGLVHLNGRVYDPRLARMTSADPTVPYPMSTQGWNRYSYAGSSPLKLVDHTGYDYVDADGIYHLVVTPICYGCGASGNSGVGAGSTYGPGGLGDSSLSYQPSLSTQIASFVNAQINAPLPTIPSVNFQLPPPPASNIPGMSGPYLPQAYAPPGSLLPQVPQADQLPSPTNGGSATAYIHGALAAASFLPSLLGSAASFADGLVYFGQGDRINGGIALGAAVLGIGADAGLVRLGLKGAQIGVDSLREGNFVYRGLAKGEDVSAGLRARAPGAGNSEISHVAGRRDSQWISTTKSPNIALEKYGEHGVVRVDLSRVETEISDVSSGFSQGGRMSNWARRDQEVLIKDFIPADALDRIK
jgi:RHS repeat-associated protein